MLGCFPTTTDAFVSLIIMVNTLMVGFPETESNGDCEKSYSLQKFSNHIKQIEMLMPPRVWFNYINVPEIQKFPLTSLLPHLLLFPYLFAC